MAPQGTGIHPIEGDFQLLGTLAYLFPLCATRDGERADAQGTEPSSGDGYQRAQGP